MKNYNGVLRFTFSGDIQNRYTSDIVHLGSAVPSVVLVLEIHSQF
jgi:hypothetical protein